MQSVQTSFLQMASGNCGPGRSSVGGEVCATPHIPLEQDRDQSSILYLEQLILYMCLVPGFMSVLQCFPLFHKTHCTLWNILSVLLISKINETALFYFLTVNLCHKISCSFNSYVNEWLLLEQWLKSLSYQMLVIYNCKIMLFLVYAYHISVCNNVQQKLGAGGRFQKKMLSFLFSPECALQRLEDITGWLLATSWV